MDALAYKAAELNNATLSRLGSEGYAIFDPATKGDLLLFVKEPQAAPTMPIELTVAPVAAPAEAMPADASVTPPAFPADAYTPPADQPTV